LWVLSNIAAGTLEHKTLIFSSEVVPLLIDLLSAAPFEIRKEAAYTLGNICVDPTKGSDSKSDIIVGHLVPLVKGGCLPGFVNLIRSADLESARVGLQFLELVLFFFH
jgi:importin subunit alpha-6/7